VSRYCSLLFLLTALASATCCHAAGPNGSFIQLTRASAGKTEADWNSDMLQMQKVGIHSLIVQWCAEPGIIYMEGDELPYPERFGTIERILSAAETSKMKVHLGLFHDPNYWTAITARESVLRDYFLVRVSQNEKVQRALLDRFRDHPAWVGCYIPDEIDDLTWRNPKHAVLFEAYLRIMCNRLRTNDPARKVSISAFFRSRTAPDVFLVTGRFKIPT